MRVITPLGREPLHLWDARDALVLKALALAVAPQLALSPRCRHAKGHGGLKAAVQRCVNSSRTWVVMNTCCGPM
jgi:RNA-directed DNA polymerase